MKVMRAAVELYPKDPGLLSDMGEAYLAMKDKQKAKEYFEKALALDPTNELIQHDLERAIRVRQAVQAKP